MMCVHVARNVHIIHTGGKPRRGACAYYFSALKEIDLDGVGRAADDDETKMHKKKRRKKSHEFDLTSESGPPPTTLQEVNTPNGFHNGLRACLAAAHALAEISRAKLHSRDVNIAEACARLERNPFAWEQSDCRRLVLLWRETSNNGLRMHHVSASSMHSLIKCCRGERKVKSKEQ